jgi:DNA-binding NtrC family response regulator
MKTQRSVTESGVGFTSESDLAYPSVAYQRTLALLELFASDSAATILLVGEPGTGKSTLAQFVHDRSPRSARPFRRVMLSSLDDSLAASELFGHVPGAYTDARHPRAGQLASANGGTLFLDEIGKASPAVQHRLVQVLERGTFTPVGSDREVRVDVRLVAATNVPLESLVERGRFLPDLLDRIGAFEVKLPSLRERRADIPLLAMQALAEHARRSGREPVPCVHPELMAALRRADWPGNIRQLSGEMHRMLVVSRGAPELTLQHCDTERLGLRAIGKVPRPLTPRVVLDAIERAGSARAAAAALDADISTVYRHLRDGKRRNPHRTNAAARDAGDDAASAQGGTTVT